MKLKVLALSFAIMSIYGCNKDSQDVSQKGMGVRVATVTVFNVIESPVDIKRDFKAKVEPSLFAEIRPQISGIITTKEINDGDNVKKGQTLYKIDSSQYEAIYEQNIANLNTAKVDLENSKMKYNRYNQLLKENAISKQEKEDVEAIYKKMLSSVKEKEALLKISKINLDYTDIKSPIDGVIGISSITQGSLVTTNQSDKINTVTNLNPIYLDVSQTSAEFFEMKEYMKDFNPTFHLKDIDYKYNGHLVSTESNVNAGSDSLKIRAKIDNPEKTLLPGMFVNVSVNYGTVENGILVPQKAVSFNPRGVPYVFLIKEKENESVVEMQEIKISNAVESNWFVKKGLKGGDKVVFDGLNKIKSGDIVNVAEIE